MQFSILFMAETGETIQELIKINLEEIKILKNEDNKKTEYDSKCKKKKRSDI